MVGLVASLKSDAVRSTRPQASACPHRFSSVSIVDGTIRNTLECHRCRYRDTAVAAWICRRKDKPRGPPDPSQSNEFGGGQPKTFILALMALQLADEPLGQACDEPANTGRSVAANLKIPDTYPGTYDELAAFKVGRPCPTAPSRLAWQGLWIFSKPRTPGSRRSERGLRPGLMATFPPRWGARSLRHVGLLSHARAGQGHGCPQPHRHCFGDPGGIASQRTCGGGGGPGRPAAGRRGAGSVAATKGVTITPPDVLDD